jgi:cytochrome c5
MDVGMLHTHTTVVVLYILYLIALFTVTLPALAPKADKVKRALRIPHIVLATLMLLTGAYLLVRSPVGIAGFSLVKYALIVAAIGFGVVGSRRGSLPLLAPSIVLMLYVFAIAKTNSVLLRDEKTRVAHAIVAYKAATPTDSLATGKAIYTIACLQCHGASGNAGFLKSKDLTVSTADDAYKAAIIKNGKGLMTAAPYLTNDEVDAVVAYINTLKAK